MTESIDPNDLQLRQIALENALRFAHERVINATSADLPELKSPHIVVKVAAIFEDFLRGKTEYQKEKSNR